MYFINKNVQLFNFVSISTILAFHYRVKCLVILNIYNEKRVVATQEIQSEIT